MKHPYMGSEPLGLPLCMRSVDYSLLPVGAMAGRTLPGGRTYTQAAGSNQTEETVRTGLSTVARWAFVANTPRIGLLADGGIGLVLEPPRTNDPTFSEALENAAWTATAGIAVAANTGDVTDMAGGSRADKVTYDGTSGVAGGFRLYDGLGVGTTGAFYTTSWWLRTLSGTLRVDISDNVTAQTQPTVTTAWGRYGYSSAAWPAATLRRVMLYSPAGVNTAFTVYGGGVQSERGRYATNLIPTGATAAARGGFRLTLPVNTYVVGGAFRAQISHVPWADCTAYDGDSATVRLWTIDANTYAEINTTTRVLTVCVNGVSRVAAVPIWWLSGHRIEWYWRVGNGALFVRYRLSTDKGVSYTLPFDPFAGVQYTDAAISTSATSLDLWSDGGSSKWFGTGACKEDFLYTAPAWSLQALPTDVASVKAFFRADSSYTLVGSGVSRWDSLCATANLQMAQGVTASQPTRVLGTGPNGTDLMSFDGGDILVSNLTRPNYFGNTDGEILCGVRIRAATLGGAGAYFNFHGIVADSSGGLGLHYRTSNVLDGGNYDGNADTAQDTYTLNSWMSLRWQHTGGNVGLSKNGAALTQTASGTTTVSAALTFGAGAVGYLTGDLTDVIVCDAALTAPQLAIIRSYLTARGLP